MKKLLFILLLLPFLSKGQTVGQFRYDTAKFYKQGGVTVLKVEGAIQVGQNPTYTTTSSASAIGQSFTLGTISSDQTITFPSLEPGRAGTFIFVDNINNSAFAWNVVGPVIERNSSGSFPVSVLPTGLHIFRWDGTNWNRLGSGGGASDSTQYTSPIAVDYSDPDFRRVYLDFPAFPQDTIGVVIHNDSLFNIHYPFDGPRDSSFIVELGASANTIYTGDGTLSGVGNRTVTQGTKRIYWTGTGGTLQTFTNNFGTGLEVFTSGIGVDIASSGNTAIRAQSNGTDPVFAGSLVPASGSTSVESFRIERNTSSGASAGIGQYWSFKAPNSSGTVFSTTKLHSTLTDVGVGTETSQFKITGIYNGSESDWFTLGNNGAARLNTYGTGTHTGTAAYQLGIDASGNLIETTGGGSLSSLSDVDVTTSPPTEGDYLKYDTLTDKWVNAPQQQVYPVRIGDSIHISNGIVTSSGAYAPISAAATWGGITGTLSSQTDLQSALNNKFTIGGDSKGTDISIGTNDVDGSTNDYKLLFKTGNVERARFYDVTGSSGPFFLFGTTSQPGADGAGVTSVMSVAGGAQFTDRLLTSTYLAFGTSASNGGRISQTDDTRMGLYATSTGMILRGDAGTTDNPFQFLGSGGVTVRTWASGTVNYRFSLGYNGSNSSATSVADVARFDPTFNMSTANGVDTSNMISFRPTYTSLTTGGKTTYVNAIRVYEGETTVRGLTLGTAGDKIKIATGSNASVGSSTLAAGTVTVSTTAVTASSKIFVTVATPGGTQGNLSIGTITAGTSFVINSTSATETSTVNWWIIN